MGPAHQTHPHLSEDYYYFINICCQESKLIFIVQIRNNVNFDNLMSSCILKFRCALI